MADARRNVQLFAEKPSRAIVPFLVVAVVGILALTLPPYFDGSHGRWLIIASAGITAILVGSVPFIPRNHWAVAVPPLLFFLVVGLLRDASGGDVSGLTTLILLPVLWIVLFGTRLQLMISAAASVLMFLTPLLLVGGPEYGNGEWRRALIWFLVIVVLCPVLQRVVETLRATNRSEKRLTGELQSVIRAATEHAIIATDLNGVITLFSPGAERMFGRPTEEVVGRIKITDFHETAELARQDVAAADPLAVLFHDVPADAAVSRIWSWRRADDSTITVRLTVSPLLGDREVQVGWTCVARDITAEEKARLELAASERRWRALLEHLPDLSVLVVDSDLRYSVAIGAGLKRQGVDNVEGRTLWETSSPRNVELLEPAFRTALAGGIGEADIEGTISGAVQHLIVVPLPPGDLQNRPEALIVARDITEQRDREAELSGALIRFTRLFNETPHGKMLLDPAGTVTMVNVALCTMTQRTPEELIGLNIHDAALSELADGGVVVDVLAGRLTRHSTEVTLRRDSEQPLYGAVNYVVLPASDQSVESVLLTVVDVSERRRYEKRLALLAETDPLTNLPNRRKFDAELAGHLNRCKRYGAKGALLLLDLDNFKQINDTLGHNAGDQLIISVATALRRRARESDVVARLGGDEFAILLPEADRAGTEKVAGDLVRLIRESANVFDGSRPRNVTASIGAVMIKDLTMTPGELFSTADLTMYDAKEAGRNQFVLHDANKFAVPRTGARIAWADRIVRALEDDDFTILAQPILDLRTNTITAAELLIRMNGEHGELIMPSHFLYVAELTGLITDIDAYMLTHAAQILERAQSLDPGCAITVNLSGRSINEHGIAALVGRLVATHAFDPRGLILEITETAAISNIETARSFGAAVTALGCRFALDDFGGGFGSFYYLKHLLFDYVKIDGEFVANSPVNPTDRLIISSIVDIARGLGKETVAEYVSDETILEVVRELGVTYAQGFHVSRPQPLDQLYDRLRHQTATPSRPATRE